MGTTCFYKNKEVPHCVSCSDKGSIMSKILASFLKQLMALIFSQEEKDWSHSSSWTGMAPGQTSIPAICKHGCTPMGCMHQSPLWEIILASWQHCRTEWLIQNGNEQGKKGVSAPEDKSLHCKCKSQKTWNHAGTYQSMGAILCMSHTTRHQLQPEDGILCPKSPWPSRDSGHCDLMTMDNNNNNKSNTQEQEQAQAPPSPPSLPWAFSLASCPPLSLTSSNTWTIMLFINKSSTTNEWAKKLLTPWRQPRKSPLERSPSLGDGHGLGQRFSKALRKYERRKSSGKKRLIRRRRWNGKWNKQMFKWFEHKTRGHLSGTLSSSKQWCHTRRTKMMQSFQQRRLSSSRDGSEQKTETQLMHHKLLTRIASNNEDENSIEAMQF